MKMRERNTPPAWAIRFFKWFCNDHLSEAVVGDMLELHERRASAMKRWRADILFILNVIQFIQPFAIRGRSPQPLNTMAMYKNYFTIAWRTMAKQKMYSLIKIGGFAIGLATCMVIALYLQHELSYDRHYTHGENIYRVYNFNNGPDGGKWMSMPAMVAQMMKHDYPEVEKAGRLIPYKWYYGGSNLFRRADKVENTFEEGFAYADQSLLEILQVPIVYGNPFHVLDKPNTIVIARSKAEKYFPGEDPVGKTVILNDEINHPFTIGGVMEDFPETTHMPFDFFITLAEVEFWEGEQTSWCCWNYEIYLQLHPGTNTARLEKNLNKIIQTHYLKYLNETGNQGAADVKKYHTFKLQPVADVHLYSSDISGGLSVGDIRYIWLFGGIAVFILLLACINFINLSTAKSANRAKEVGLRKVVGSLRGYIIRQFLTESMIFSLISFMLALILVQLSLPYFNDLADMRIAIPWTAWWLFPMLLGAAFVVGFVAGVYPSFYLSSFKPIDVLKGSIARGMKGSMLRSAMVVFQFTTSIVLLIGTFVIQKQMDFILKSKVGFDKDQVLMIQGVNTLGKQMQAFKDELNNLAGVKSATLSFYYPVTGTKRDQNMFWNDGRSTIDMGIGAQRWFVDEDYIETLGIKLIEGRNFDSKVRSDSQAVIINQAMAKALNLKKPIGAKVQNWKSWNVIAVVEDFNFENMKGKIGPLCFTLGDWGNIMAVKISSKDMRAMIASVTGLWNRFMPNQPIRYTFMDESYERIYADVQRTGKIFASFSVLAIIVACLGLFALSAFMVEQRNKEVSIRLVLGASLQNIFRLLTQNFVTMVVISFLIAAPLGWVMMNAWLSDYAYRTEITLDIFLIAGGLAVVIALLTVSYQSIRAALANPANSLRSE